MMFDKLEKELMIIKMEG